MRRKIENVLMELGVTPDHIGFVYICRAIEMILENMGKRNKLVDGIYRDIAKEYDSTVSRVERSMRHAFSKIDIESGAFIKYINTEKLTNSVLLYTLAYRLREDETDESRD